MIELNDRSGTATVLSAIGVIWSSSGDNLKALAFYNRALELRRAGLDKGGQAATLTNIGAAHSNLGDRLKALKFYEEALALMREDGDPRGESIILSNLGALHDKRGDQQKALDFFLQSIEARERIRTAAKLEELKSKIAEQFAAHRSRRIPFIPEDALPHSSTSLPPKELSSDSWPT